MPDRPTALTAAAGEHFISYKLCLKGYLVALTRGGSPVADILVANPQGTKTVSVQVKTSSYAWREFKRKPENNHWEWDVGRKALEYEGDSLFYAFVDLKGGNPDILPSVFIVPSHDVKLSLGQGWSRYMFWIGHTQKDKYLERWDLFEDESRTSAR